MIIKSCLLCNKEFTTYHRKAKFCTHDCYAKMKKIRGDKVKLTPEGKERIRLSKIGSKNPQFGKKPWNLNIKMPEITGDKHPRWKGGKYLQDGYVFRSIKGRQQQEHRRIMEEHLGRRLNSDEIVHHINEDKTDNRIENLQVLTRSEHVKLHFWNSGGGNVNH